MGNGMSLAGLVIPLKGGIVLDMKRMNKILEVNHMARYVVVEGGTSQGALKAYLQKNHPTLRHSIPDAPSTTTIAANVSLRRGLTNRTASIRHGQLEAVPPTGGSPNRFAVIGLWIKRAFPICRGSSGLAGTGVATKVKSTPTKRSGTRNFLRTGSI